MKTSILALAIGVVLAYPAAAYADGIPTYSRTFSNPPTIAIEPAMRGSNSTWTDPFKPRTTDGLSSNRNACASYGCVGAGGD